MLRRIAVRGWPRRAPQLAITGGCAVALFALFSLVSPGFFSTDSLINLAWSGTALAIIATGQTLLMLSGAADLSVGSMMALAAIPCIALLNAGVPVAPAMFAGIAVGVLFGSINGLITEGLRLPSFVVTFGTLAVYRGLAFVSALLVAGGLQSITVGNSDYIFLGRGGWIGTIPPSLVIVIILVVGLGLLSSRTRYGLAIRAIGSNQEVAKEAGIHPARVRITLFAASGALAALAGLLQAAGDQAVSPSLTGTTLEFQSVIAVILGGTRITGGEGGIGGTLIAVALMTILVGGLESLGLDPRNVPTVQGVLLLLVVGTQGVLSLRRSQRLARQ